MMNRVRLKKDGKDGGLMCEGHSLEVWLADSFLTRLRGLLGKKRLAENEGLLLKDCAAVHTIGMHYSLDLVFMDKDGKVLKCLQGVKPFRGASARGAYYALELCQGSINRHGISNNDHFSWEQV